MSRDGQSAPRTVFLELRPRSSRFDLVKEMRFARDHGGKSVRAQLVDIVRLALGPGRLRPIEYYGFRVYDPHLDDADRRRFAGDRLRGWLLRKQIERAWLASSTDKVLFYMAMRGAGLPIPETVAMFHASRCFGEVRALRTAEELTRYLHHDVPLPFFSKPVESTGSAGIAHVVGRDGDSLVVADGRRVEIAQFVRDVGAFGGRGYLFQERLAPDPELEAVHGDRLSGVRCLVILEDAGPAVVRATWKIPAGTNQADNFWRSGNLVGAVDAATGRVERVVRGSGARQEVVDAHPDTGAVLTGLRLPHWERVLDLCRVAAASLPGLPLQGWDIVFSAKGPVLMEMEGDGGSQTLTQYATGRGILDERMVAFIARWGRAHAARRRGLRRRNRRQQTPAASR